MDPKMDSGYVAPGDTLEDDYNVLKELLPEEVVGIMDQMLCSEVCRSPHSRIYQSYAHENSGGVAYGEPFIANALYFAIPRSTTLA